MVVKLGDKWVVISDSNKYVGTYDSQQVALQRELIVNTIQKQIDKNKKV